MLYRFLKNRIVKLESFNAEGINFKVDFKPQYRVVRWFNFKYRDEAGIKRDEKFSTVEGARSFLAFKTGQLPSSKRIVTVIE